jgi:hydroxyacylglutathione hydrolase
VQAIVKTYRVGPLQANCYLVVCPQTNQAAVIDPGDEGEQLHHFVQEAGANLKLILATHGHFDHVAGVPELKRLSGAPFWISKDEWELWAQHAHEHPPYFGLPAGEPLSTPDRFLQEGDTFTLGTLSFQVLAVPGHGPDHVAFLMQEQPMCVFCGDTLFAGSIGRTDIPYADHETLLHHIRTRLLTLPDDTVVYSGHGMSTTIGVEKETNPYL